MYFLLFTSVFFLVHFVLSHTIVGGILILPIYVCTFLLYFSYLLVYFILVHFVLSHTIVGGILLYTIIHILLSHATVRGTSLSMHWFKLCMYLYLFLCSYIFTMVRPPGHHATLLHSRPPLRIYIFPMYILLWTMLCFIFTCYLHFSCIFHMYDFFFCICMYSFFFFLVRRAAVFTWPSHMLVRSTVKTAISFAPCDVTATQYTIDPRHAWQSESAPHSGSTFAARLTHASVLYSRSATCVIHATSIQYTINKASYVHQGFYISLHPVQLVIL